MWYNIFNVQKVCDVARRNPNEKKPRNEKTSRVLLMVMLLAFLRERFPSVYSCIVYM